MKEVQDLWCVVHNTEEEYGALCHAAADLDQQEATVRLMQRVAINVLSSGNPHLHTLAHDGSWASGESWSDAVVDNLKIRICGGTIGEGGKAPDNMTLYSALSGGIMHLARALQDAYPERYSHKQ